VITLTILTFNGGPTERLSATFDELGGTIGRADTNQLVLPDPERTISRVHAQVAFRNGGFALVDRGSNPVLINGRALGNGSEAPLKAGDQVQIGGYVLSVEAASAGGGTAAASADPFADLMGFGGGMAGAPASAGHASQDPFAALAPASNTGGGSPWGSPAPNPLFGASPSPAPTASSAPAGGIPLDWDPFAPDPAPASNDLGRSLGAAPATLPDDFGLGLGSAPTAPLIPDVGIRPTAAEDSLDNLFGLGPASNHGGDPLAGSALQDPLSKPNTAQNADPLRSFMSGPASGSGDAAMADNVSELNTPFIPPKVVPAAPPAKPPAAPAAPIGSGPAPQGAVLSWGDQSGAENRTIIRPAGKPAAATPATPSSTPAAAYAPPPAAPRPTASAAMAGSADVQALLAAFREGLGVPSLQIDALTPELMKLVGQLLHESAKGTVDLLVARAALKREIRAEVTMIVARENNPLKFSPSVEVALNHLLTPPARGFMQPAPAMRDAYDDLRAHQFGFVAGMKAALEGVLKRFDPAVLEGKLTQKSVINSLLPATRKAKLWEVFQELYGQISEEAAEDFHELFGREFLRAYEAHIDQLKDGQH
jgi:FHA domain-containing protein